MSRLVFVFNWPGSTLKLKVFEPDGSLFNQKVSDSPPVTIVVPEAQPGKWKYQIEGVEVPFDNYPYAVAVGDKNLYTSFLYLPTILDK